MSVITVTHLSKAYKRYSSLGARLGEWLSCGYKTFHQLNWVLRDINLSVEPGESVGIVGMNGAGKSTLLKIITQTCYPTQGTVTVNGQVSALLELGLGFHPELTGRQNVFIVGQLLGYKSSDIVQLMPEIESFAEIGGYMDQPLRLYSSGMKMRLGFSIATIGRPDVMIVDEALSVGDGYFQHKCFKRIRELQKQGTALLLVSHDSALVTAVCERAVLLHNGCVINQGDTELILNYYKALLADFDGKSIRQHEQAFGKIQIVSGTGEASIETIRLYNEADDAVSVVNVGETVRLCIVVQANVSVDRLTLGYEIKDVFGQPVFGTNTHHLEHTISQLASGERVTFDFTFAANLGLGNYSISVALHAGDTHLEHNYEWRDLAFVFSVVNLDKAAFIGAAWLPPHVRSKRLNAVEAVESVT